MSSKRNKIIRTLAAKFLSYRDPDEGQFRVIWDLNRLYYSKGMSISIEEVQEYAYSKEVK